VLSRVVRHQLQVVGSLPIALFRIVYCSILAFEVAGMWAWRRVYVEAAWIEVLIPLWAASIVLLGLGLLSRWAALANFGLAVVVLAALRPFTSHADVVILTTNLLLLVVPSSGRLSLDARRGAAVDGVVRMGPDLMLFVGVGLFYADSVLWKLGSHTWTTGLGFWRPAALPQLTRVDLGALLDNRALVLVLGYGILVFEGTFLILMWFRRLRLPLLALGMALHLGIALVFPLTVFGLLMSALMLLLLPTPELGRVGDVRPLAAVGLALVAAQVVATAQVPWLGVPLPLRDAARSVTAATAQVVGVREHALFLDQHLDDLVAQKVEGPDGLMPFNREDGTPDDWLRDRRFAVWTWGGPLGPAVATHLIERFVPGTEWRYYQARLPSNRDWVAGYRAGLGRLSWVEVASS
jgi:hypothetical protein